jgi:hypothetical protein
MIHRSNLEPTKKFEYPQTTSQEIGWITTPLVIKILIIINQLFLFLIIIKLETNKSDRRLNYNRVQTEICAYAEEYYKFNPKKPATFTKKEQAK